MHATDLAERVLRLERESRRWRLATLVLLSVWLVPAATATPRTAEIDRETLDAWSAPYRGWYYWPGHIIASEPRVPGYPEFRNPDVPCVYQVPGGPAKWYMSYVAFNGQGYNSFVAQNLLL